MSAQAAAAADPAPPPASDGGPRLYGAVDVLRADRITGWAIDRADAAAAVEIEILREGRQVALVRADRPRRDLERGGVGTGRYGFAAELVPPLEPGLEFTVVARARSADGVATTLRRSGAGPADPDRRLLERVFEELVALRDAAAQAPGVEAAEALVTLACRLELAQVRIEATLAAVEPPPPTPLGGGLRLLLGLALATGIGSLALGIASLWAG